MGNWRTGYRIVADSYTIISGARSEESKVRRFHIDEYVLEKAHERKARTSPSPAFAVEKSTNSRSVNPPWVPGKV